MRHSPPQGSEAIGWHTGTAPCAEGIIHRLFNKKARQPGAGANSTRHGTRNLFPKAYHMGATFNNAAHKVRHARTGKDNMGSMLPTTDLEVTTSGAECSSLGPALHTIGHGVRNAGSALCAAGLALCALSGSSVRSSAFRVRSEYFFRTSEKPMGMRGSRGYQQARTGTWNYPGR